jgi:pantothenate kinase type III
VLLAVNINNTQIKIGGYRGTELLFHWRIATDREKTDDEYAMILRELFRHIELQFAQVESVALSCVVPPLTDVFDRLCRRYFGVSPLIVGPGIRTGMRIHYENPKEVGADRICSAVAVYEKYGGPAIVVDFGTATTYTAVSASGEFLGGAIAPGVGISVGALAEHAAQLPYVELVKPAPSSADKPPSWRPAAGPSSSSVNAAALITMTRCSPSKGYASSMNATGSRRRASARRSGSNPSRQDMNRPDVAGVGQGGGRRSPPSASLAGLPTSSA